MGSGKVESRLLRHVLGGLKAPQLRMVHLTWPQGPSCLLLFGVPAPVLPLSPYPSRFVLCWALGADDGHPRRQLCGGNQAATERIILFGRELQALSEQLGREYGKNLAHTEMLQV